MVRRGARHAWAARSRRAQIVHNNASPRSHEAPAALADLSPRPESKVVTFTASLSARQRSTSSETASAGTFPGITSGGG